MTGIGGSVLCCDLTIGGSVMDKIGQDSLVDSCSSFINSHAKIKSSQMKESQDKDNQNYKKQIVGHWPQSIVSQILSIVY